MGHKPNDRRLLSRRQLIRSGLVTGGAAFLAGSSSTSAQQAGSPVVEPFADELPVPAIAEPVSDLVPAPNPGTHQRYSEFLPQKFYEIPMVEALHSFHRDLPPSRIWGFNGLFPGPTFRERYGVPILVRFRNDLPADHVGFGIPSVITHLHNGHTASESDGFPLDFYGSGQYKDHHYPNVLAGYDAFPPAGDEREALGTLFYHDHRIDFTAQNVYRGLAGFYLLFDESDSGDETDANPKAFCLPSGEFDVPLMFSDKRFTPGGELFYDPFDLNGFVGDRYTVNGKIQPFFQVAARKYRFRLLNAGPSRFYEFFLSNGQPFIQIGSDGNLLPQPIARTSIRLGVAERADVIVDFSGSNIGDQILLENRLEQISGRGPTGRLLEPGTPLMRFDVNYRAADRSRIPENLRALPGADPDEAVVTRTWTFNNRNGAWTINNRLFDSSVVSAVVKKDSAEIWVLQTGGGNWSHPVHIHFEEFQILSRNGIAPPIHEIARKDIARLEPRNNARVFLRFRDFTGRYVMHCHNLLHEDHAMMILFEVQP